MGKFIDLSGQTFSRLTAVERGPNKGVKATWLCRCLCGRLVFAHGHDLRKGKHRSCGCLHKDIVTKHGQSCANNDPKQRSLAYRRWCSMKSRAGRGPWYSHVSVCDRWQSFKNFVADLGQPPTPQHTLDRYPDRAGNYEPGNVRWATPSEQSNNTSRCKYTLYRGKTQSIAMWARELGVPIGRVRSRMERGWPFDKAVELPAGAYLRNV